MKVGDLVSSRHDHSYRGIVIEVAPIETRIDHGDIVCKVLSVKWRWEISDLSEYRNGQ